VTASLPGLLHRLVMCVDLLIRCTQVAQRLLQSLRCCELHPGAERRLAIEMERMRDRSTPREAHDDLRRLGHLLNRHLPEIGQRILCLAQPAHRAAVFQREVIRSHSAVAGPANQTGDDPVLAPLLQHADRLGEAAEGERKEKIVLWNHAS
jgi:hypothetical protein